MKEVYIRACTSVVVLSATDIITCSALSPPNDSEPIVLPDDVFESST